MAKATMDLMQGLHGALAKYYKDFLDIANKEEEEISSGTLAAINSFLKNNNITVDAVESDTMMDLGFTLRDMVESN